MRYTIYKNNTIINTITCNPNFIDEYCNLIGATYTVIGNDIHFISNDEAPSFEETTTAKIQAIIDQQTFLEDCIAEMAAKVYA